MINMEKQRCMSCGCFHNNVVLESFVIVFTFISALAITGGNLLTFDLITVPKNEEIESNFSLSNNSNNGEGGGTGRFEENAAVLDILDKVFHFTSLAIAGIFAVEIAFKVFTLRKEFLSKPWQLFDCFIVIATLGVELAFQFVELEPAFDSFKYVVVLRLWRIPMVCNIRANILQQCAEQDIEFYKCARTKAEERCNWLENCSSQQAETIQKLEESLHNLKGSTPDEMTNGDAHKHNAINTDNSSKKQGNGSAPKKAVSPSPVKGSTRRSLLRRSKQNVSSNEMETEFTDTTPSQNLDTTKHLRAAEDGISKEIQYSENAPGYAVNSNAIKSMSTKDTLTRVLPRSEASYNLHVETTRPQNLRTRKRRSSTSEYIDYSSLSSPEKEIHDDTLEKAASCPALDVDIKNNIEKDEENNDINYIEDEEKEDRDKTGTCTITKRVSSASDTPSETSTASSNGKKERRQRKRRFTSCPEYVFTQRMSITSDESMLIGDKHTIEDTGVYDNMAFNDEDIRLQVLAEFDGTKTYRNEDGIPMTSL